MIRFNNLFTSHRREASGTARQYASSATITNGLCYLQPLDGETRAVLGIDDAVEAFVLLTDETDILRKDKVVISSVNYFVLSVRKQHYDGAFKMTRAVIKTETT